MVYKNILFLIIICSITACQWGKPGKKEPVITKDTLKYSYKTIKQRAPDCGEKPDSSCTVFQVRYPIFPNQTLNDTVKQAIVSQFQMDDKKPDTSLRHLAQHFIKSYEEDKKTDNRPGIIYSLNSKVKVIRQDSSLITLEVAQQSYLGGAHGSATVAYINWNTKTNKKIQLTDILIDAYQQPLNKIAERIFRKQEKLADTASLTHGYFFKDDQFSVNDNFLVNPTGLLFYYNEYEIKPYVAGPTELLIPYSQIKSLLRPNTVVAQYHK